MNPQQARARVAETFSQPFNRARFLEFTRNLLNKFDESKAAQWNTTYVKDAFKPHVARFERLGTYTSPDGDKLDVLVVHLMDESKLERARTAIRNFVADHLKTRDEKEAALVAFVSPTESQWRFSYVKMEYAAVETESGKIGIETRITPARRSSYIVGEGESCHTAQARFLDLLKDTENFPTLAQIEDAFSVEAVTKEFFNQYAGLFVDIDAALQKLAAKASAIGKELKTKNVSTVDFAKKLLGQIVFLYFLQKKGWLGVTKGQGWGTGPHDFLRRLARGDYGTYENFFNDVLEPLLYDTLATDRGHEAWCKILKCRIPFLNGGLFEPIGDYDWRKIDISLSNKLFTNTEPNDEGDIGTGVLDVFDRYYFTVNEAEPLEKEVAIDPEMLGKVFENLIEENLRKGLGSFYTPREIVHYMCQESLINYLDAVMNSVGSDKRREVVSRADLETFIHLGDQISHYEAVETRYDIKMPKSIEQHARLIDQKLSDITICDPAVGSGAFPVGMMTEIVRGRSALTPYFNDIHDRTPYHFKRHAIQNCLYGVDIDPGAVEIAKLRLWLSLVVDEEDVKQIKPLPNLFYKIVTGNSLLGVEKNLFNQQLFRRLEELKPRYFNEPDKDKKHQYKQQIEDTIHRLTKGKEAFDFEIYFSEVFHNNVGFDGKFDIYVLFVEKGFSLIAPSGVIVYIHPHRFLTADYGRGLKAFLDGERGLQSAMLFGVDQIFETATTYTGVFAYSRNNEFFQFKHVVARDFVRGAFTKRSYAAGGSHWNLSTEEASSSDLIEKLRAQPRKLSELCRGVFQGIVTVGDDIFILKGNLVGKKFVGWSEAAQREVELEADIVKPLVKGENIQRYQPLSSDIWIFYPHYQDQSGKTRAFTEAELRTRYPKAFAYIRPFKKHLVAKKIQYKTNPDLWFSLHRSREMSLFEQPKIITPQLQNHPSFTFDQSRWYPDAGGYSIILNHKSKDNYMFLLGVLNSSLLWYFIRSTSNPYNNSYYYFKTKYLEPFSLPARDGEKEMRIAKLAERVQAGQSERGRADTSVLEQEIDQLVYALYGLTSEEIQIVESATK
jgi:type I restriction-modification system DNA methylase subunit